MHVPPLPAAVNYPIRHGIVENWDNMERYWQRCIFKYLRCDPEEHNFLLTEPVSHPPRTRARVGACTARRLDASRPSRPSHPSRPASAALRCPRHPPPIDCP